VSKLFLIPTPLGMENTAVIPPYVADIIRSLDLFIVERAKTARHHIKAICPDVVLPNLVMEELNEHDSKAAEAFFLQHIATKKNIGLMSEAGCPGVADPGATIVALAHQHQVEVIPLVGPSSILLALMGSGMNGQSFAFHGYLGAKTDALLADLKRLETQAIKQKQAQIFIETPYRNKNVFDTALKNLSPNTRLCIACDLTLPTQYLKTMTIAAWKKATSPDLHKRPIVFIIG
jgi:16S rRNA (cytidine1402-2'-O)-methyltransferase